MRHDHGAMAWGQYGVPNSELKKEDKQQSKKLEVKRRRPTAAAAAEKRSATYEVTTRAA